jgi:hypothetical protein
MDDEHGYDDDTPILDDHDGEEPSAVDLLDPPWHPTVTIDPDPDLL